MSQKKYAKFQQIQRLAVERLEMAKIWAEDGALKTAAEASREAAELFDQADANKQQLIRRMVSHV